MKPSLVILHMLLLVLSNGQALQLYILRIEFYTPGRQCAYHKPVMCHEALWMDNDN